MGKELFAILMVAIVATFAGYNLYQSQRMETMSDLMLANVEALADDSEYVIGTIGTNWKTYRVTCTKTVGFDYGLVYTKTTTYIFNI